MEKIYTAKDFDRLRVIQSYMSGEYTRKMAAMNLGVSERQITRIVRKYTEEGPASVIHGNTGKQALNKSPDELKKQIVSLYTGKYGVNGAKLNFCHFKEKLEDEGINVPYSTMRRILIEAGIKPTKRKRSKVVCPPRPRRVFPGELLQADASIHAWLYDDKKNYALHGAIDDATGTITGLWFEKAENMHGYQMVLYQTMKNYGIPRALYTDNRNVFEAPKTKNGKPIPKFKLNSPRFKALLTHLGIKIIPTSNPRAKGRIERLWRTLQSRLYNEMLLRRITTLKEANDFAKEYLPTFNRAFAYKIDYSKSRFINVPADYDYNRNLAIFKDVNVNGGCYVTISGHYYVAKGLKELNDKDGRVLPKKCMLYRFLDGNYHLQTEDGEWYDLVDVGPTSAHKEINSKIMSDAAKRNVNSPWRRTNSYLFKPKRPSKPNSKTNNGNP